MKKILLSAAAAIMAASSLVGVSVSAQEKVTIDFAAVETAYGTGVWQEIMAAYKEVNPNVEFEFLQEKELEDALAPRLQSGDFPDVVMLALNRPKALTEALVKDKAISDVTDIRDITIPGEEKTVGEKIFDGFLDSTSTNPYADGHTYLMPMFYSPTGLFYNKGLFAEKGWEVPKTWDEMWALADVAKEEGISLFTYPTAGYFDTFYASIILSAGGQELFDKAMSYDTDTWSGDKLAKVFEVLGKLAENTEPTTVANANGEGFTRNQQLVLDNKALFMPNGTWIAGEMAEAPRAEGFEWGLTAIPTVEEGADRYAYTFLEHIWIPEEAEHKEAAKEFIAFLYSDKAAEIFAKHGAAQPINGIDAYLDGEIAEFSNVYADGVKPGMGGFVATEAIEGVSLGDTLYEAFNSVVTGDLSIEDYKANVLDVMAQFKALLPAE